MRQEERLGWNLEQSYKSLPDIFYIDQKPEPVSKPRLVVYQAELADMLGLTIHDKNINEFTEIFAGNELPVKSEPIAQAYAGHQFGHFTMLGDGRNILLGEQITDSGEKYDVVLKGAGRTLFSRGGDGRAQLGPMLREYLISEAMHALNIRTTRSLAIVMTGDVVFRRKPMPGAILTRVASSHIRIGTFEFALHWGSHDELKQLADYTIERHFPHLLEEENRYEKLLYDVIEKQAQLIAKWQLVGFIHGVMNTDNMLLSGETIDYGPCAFLDEYDPNAVFSSIDHTHRYAYKNQPYIAEWNLTRFAETILPLLQLNKEEAIEAGKRALRTFFPTYKREWMKLAKAKIGLQDEGHDDEPLIRELFTLMEESDADFTNTFYKLTTGELDGEQLFKEATFKKWHNKWQERLKLEKRTKQEIKAYMQKHNPSVIPRNYYVEEAIEQAISKADFSLFHELLNAVINPFSYENVNETFQSVPKKFNKSYRTFCGT